MPAARSSPLSLTPAESAIANAALSRLSPRGQAIYRAMIHGGDVSRCSCFFWTLAGDPRKRFAFRDVLAAEKTGVLVFTEWRSGLHGLFPVKAAVAVRYRPFSE